MDGPRPPISTPSWPPSTQLALSAPEKSSQIYIRDYPQRALAIISSSHALIFRYSAATSDERTARQGTPDGPQAKCMVEFTKNTKQILADYRPLTPRPIFGTLGLIAVNSDVFLSVVTHATRAATVRPGETVERIASVDFYCLNTADYDDIVMVDTVDDDLDGALRQNFSQRDQLVEHPCQELRKLLSNGTFYYSTDFDLTNRLQDRPVSNTSFDIDNFDESFLWNSFMISPLVKFRSRLMPHERDALDHSRILTSAIRGYCGTMTIPQAAAPLRAKQSGFPSFLSVISRLSCRRAGTRFNSRGIDDDGNVANFVETETTFWSPGGTVFSYAQVRGSVPVFWEQAADLIPGRQKITITRSSDGTQPSFDKHFEDLEQNYGAVHIVNLLSETKPGEAELAHLYRSGINHCPLRHPGGGKSSTDHSLLRASEYDFHAETKAIGYEAAKGIRRYIQDSIDGFAYYLAEKYDDSAEDNSMDDGRLVAVLQQEGVFRTNCLDCLDRTNLIQTIISQMAFETFLSHRGEYAASDFWVRHSSLWADNGDALSKIYAGTGALKSSFTRTGKMSLSGAMADLRKSAQRLYHNNFTDPSKQMTIDLLLGRLVGQQTVHLVDPISDFVSLELSKRSAEYCSTQSITILVGTFNLNGRTNGVNEDLSSWLSPRELGSNQPEIVAVGFQEIVELSPQQIMNSDPSRRQLWEQSVKKTLNQYSRSVGGDAYVLLRSGQLVGAALCIFVKSSVLSLIKNVEGSVKKTGMSGMAGNKGAVAIRLDFANTHICFVTAHLAAGFTNYDERNRDYATIHHGLRFQRNRSIDDHDSVVWLGDFNYRIGLDREKADEYINAGDLERLYENDQLNLQMVAGYAFPFYSEARIGFLPTYKFDIGTDEYDSSEKARIPAWTDRILRKGTNLKQLAYNSAPLRFSDHRPIYAVFRCIVSIVDEEQRQSISDELYRRRKADVGEATANLETESTDDEELMGYDAVEPGLPPASSDRQKWWLDNGQPARASVAPPRAANGTSMVLNRNRPPNPFTPTEEPDWVSVPRSSSKQSLSSISTSPYEVVNIPPSAPTNASGPGPRKLPPPFDPAKLPARAGRTSTLEDAHGTEFPPPPPPRRQTGIASSTAQAQKQQRQQQLPQHAGRPAPRPAKSILAPPPPPPSRASSGKLLETKPPATAADGRTTKSPPPPVAKKPSHLATTSPTTSWLDGSPNGAAHDDNGDHRHPAIPARAPTSGSKILPPPSPSPSRQQTANVIKKPVPPKSTKPTASMTSGIGTPSPPLPPPMSSRPSSTGKPAGAVALPGMIGTSGVGSGHARAKPAVPAKIQKKSLGRVDLLGDDAAEGNGSMGGWESLKPS